jgi:hypothetical protein
LSGACNQGVIKEALIQEGIGNYHDLALHYCMGAEGDVSAALKSAKIIKLYAHCGGEKHMVRTNHVYNGDGHAKHVGGDLHYRVETFYQLFLFEPVAGQGLQALRLVGRQGWALHFAS